MTITAPDIDKQLQEVLTRFPELVLALPFGAVAEGRPRPDSDLDIAVAAKQVPVAQGEKFITAMPNWQFPLDCFPGSADFYHNETCL
ncbi:MAG: nucleotidyltransferase domain-containing protein [Methylococcaceae bacterium]